jgi:hypothetical protein
VRCEVYGDWHEDPEQLETTVSYLLDTDGGSAT